MAPVWLKTGRCVQTFAQRIKQGGQCSDSVETNGNMCATSGTKEWMDIENKESSSPPKRTEGNLHPHHRSLPTDKQQRRCWVLSTSTLHLPLQMQRAAQTLGTFTRSYRCWILGATVTALALFVHRVPQRNLSSWDLSRAFDLQDARPMRLIISPSQLFLDLW